MSELDGFHDTLAESSVVGACLITDDYTDDILAAVKPEDIYDIRLRKLYAAVIEAHTAGKPLDGVVLFSSLAKTDRERTDWQDYIRQVAVATPAAAPWKHYANIVLDKARRRKLNALLQSTQTELTNGMPTDTAINTAHDILLGVLEERGGATIELKDALELYINNMGRIARDGKSPTIPTGYRKLDRITGGMPRGRLIILAARPGVGKSALAANIAINVAAKGYRVIFFNLELSTEEITGNMMARQGGPSIHDMHTGRLTPKTLIEMRDAVDSLMGLPITLSKESRVSTARIAAVVRAKQRASKVGLVIIDYLQLLEMPRVHGQNREREVATTARELKLMSRELDCPILCICQLNRGPEDRQNSRPRLRDLRESGALEQDSDQVWMLNRPCMRLREEDREKREASGKTTADDYCLVYVEKNRTGPTGDVTLGWDAERIRFEDWL